jgi:hypothetical protein
MVATGGRTHTACGTFEGDGECCMVEFAREERFAKYETSKQG